MYEGKERWPHCQPHDPEYQDYKEREGHPLGLLFLNRVRDAEVAVELYQCEDDPTAEPEDCLDRTVNEQPHRKMQREHKHQEANYIYGIAQHDPARPTWYEPPIGEKCKGQ